MKKEDQIEAPKQDWETNPRWKRIKRPYLAEDVLKLRGKCKN